MKNPTAAVTEALAGKSKPAKHKVVGVHLRKGHQGGYIVRHDLEDEDGNRHPKTPEYPLASMADVHKHMDEHMGEGC